MIHFHKWTKWQPITLLVRPNLGGIGMPPVYGDEYRVDGQGRSCEKCGKIQKKRV